MPHKGGVRHSLPLEEQGAYRLLLDHMWIKGGHLKNDDKEIARTLRITVKKWQKIKPRLAEYLQIDKGNITQKRLQDDYQNAVTRSEINAKDGKTGGLKSAENRKAHQANATAQGDLLAPANQRTHGSTRHIREVLKKP